LTDKPLSTMRCDSFSPQSAQGRTDKVALGHYEKAFVTSYCWCAYVWKRITALVRKYKNTKPTRSTRSTESYGTPNTLWRSRRPLLKGRTCSSFLAYDWVSPDPAVCCSNSSRELRHRSTALRVVCSWGPGALLVRKRFPELAARVFCCKLKSYVELIRLRRARALYPPLDGEGFGELFVSWDSDFVEPVVGMEDAWLKLLPEAIIFNAADSAAFFLLERSG